MSELDDLYDDLSEFAAPKPKRAQYTAREERVIAGFEDILRFREEHGRTPLHGEDRDIFERLYAVRLDQLRAQSEFHELLTPIDTFGLLDADADHAVADDDDLDALAEDLQGFADPESDITKLRHVKSREERRAAEEIANRELCEDFEKFGGLFAQVEADIQSGVREARKFVKDAGFSKADITTGQFFIVGGQIAYIAEVGETIKAPNGQFDARMRVVYANGTENNLLRRSMQRALYKDDAGRRITEAAAGPLFGATVESYNEQSGTIYVLRSKSDHPTIAAHREVIHKIGVTGGTVEARIAAADKSATYLLADVECVAHYKLFNINRKKLEALLHKFFSAAQFDIEIKDRFGNPVKPREWFLVPLSAINEAVERIQDGTIADYRYDPEQGALVLR
ncbi:MAG: GIY-YIG nuclease family protein [Pontixanthobacter sp.]